MHNPASLKTLQQHLKYSFADLELLRRALTHTSARYEFGLPDDHQRLEFLGDAVLGLIAAEYGYDQTPMLNEGQLTRLRSYVSSTAALAAIARAINIGPCLLLGKGEQMSGGDNKDNNLADALEAIMGAAYKDGGLPAARTIFTTWFTSEGAEHLHTSYTDNPKGRLQEWAQQQGLPCPTYKLLDEDGPPHARIFTVRVEINEILHAQGTANNKKSAEAIAAQQLWAQLDNGTTTIEDQPNIK